MAYILYCDESASLGEKYSDFFGGCIINSLDQYEIVSALENKKEELNLFAELKWTKVTENYLDKYISFIDLFFDYVKSSKIKVRIMFRKTDEISSKEERNFDDKYFKLYYQFIKHAFGFMTIPHECTPCNIIINLDSLPDKKAKCEKFKEYLHDMPNTHDFIDSNIQIRSRDIIEVDSKNHVLSQCVDIVLGAMNFRLNELNLKKDTVTNRRGKRTIAKEKLYKHILKRICDIHPNFNIGVSTSKRGYDNPHWCDPYEHWLFRSY